MSSQNHFVISVSFKQILTSIEMPQSHEHIQLSTLKQDLIEVFSAAALTVPRPATGKFSFHKLNFRLANQESTNQLI